MALRIMMLYITINNKFTIIDMTGITTLKDRKMHSKYLYPDD